MSAVSARQSQPRRSLLAGAAPVLALLLLPLAVPAVKNDYGPMADTRAANRDDIIMSLRREGRPPEQVDLLSPEEVKNRLLVLLGLMDRNGDQLVQNEELVHWITRSHQAISRERAAKRLRAADWDGDGTVSRQEHEAGLHEEHEQHRDLSHLSEHEQQQLKEGMRLHQRQAGEMFDRADVDKDGRLSADEYQAFSFPEESPRMLDLLVNHTLERLDTNRDDFVNFREYMAPMMLHDGDVSYDMQLTERERYDASYDQDGDGVLNRREVRDWLSADPQLVGRNEVLHLLPLIDEDLDGAMSIEEILKQTDHFKRSEAMDYGEHLVKMHRFKDEL